MNSRLLLATLVALATAGYANAQESAAAAATPATSGPIVAPAPIAVDDSLTAAIGTSYLDNSIRGFGKAEILGPDGKKHFVWIPINLMGFNKYLPFHRHEEDLKRFGREPFSIDVDKVQSIKLNGLYQEHMVLKGKRKHLIATRVVNGPVELFNYTEMVQSGAVMVPVGGVAGLAVYHNLAILALAQVEGVLHTILQLEHHRTAGINELQVVFEGQWVGVGRLAVGPDEHLAVV